ncbi:hypothetical protein DOY81_001418 [Sarcophaga bullata]|nr:hypothetical protein DOY81_001418 [Sarcophaga bullata]
MNANDLVKVSYRYGLKSVVIRYVYFRSDFNEFYQEIHKKHPYGSCEKSLYWVDNKDDHVLIANQEDFNIFKRLTTGLQNRHIFVMPE